ncbi:hypothetical protein SPRG_01771 [Saprolegnia parasitica CBS 223.65]|uniref:Mitochondrial fission process protein 1 n=1 Tax=Saprolegnia parasitica (strain CBS 223.65) TaxID=695850 RepID=A0A067D594_SAPPC|nr:hypothetical protein SPRG_01771 [Saprolegnia parasitica CBS 223.65]KDO33891.1 hypothetical protein SPRG_01771 [Saprolegnia parasitica CBS 223.65]|eukprot:XP_012195527.1 hypothetical protein SPRG_01771 [Saprolegnia parasitica CBS 223.65]
MANVEKDILRDGPLRYLGYANELGESFRPVFPALVAPSYAVAFAYVAADTYDKASKAGASAPPPAKSAHMAAAAGDTLLWQTMASVVIPGFTINRVVALSKAAVTSSVKNPALVRWLPTCIGLGAIPLIIHPIDALVDFGMDNSTRVWSAKYLEGKSN